MNAQINARAHPERAEPWPGDRGRGPAFVPRGAAEAQLVAVARVLSSCGGMVAADDLAGLLRGRVEQPLSTVARWIVAREVVSVAWRARTLLPLFQFDLASARVRAPVATVVSELVDVFDDGELARWFAEPNVLLGNISPVQRISADPGAVLAAARADRFIARG